MSAYLLKGAISNAVNFPSITAEEAPRLRPFVKLAEQLGSFAGQLTESTIKGIEVEYSGAVAELNVKPITAAAVASVLKWHMGDGVNMVSAVSLAEQRGVKIATTTRGQDGAYESYVKLTVMTDEYDRSVGGTVFSDGRPRFIQVRDINMEFEVTPHMLFVRNSDKPGFIGKFGMVMGEAGVNIATLNLGRDKPGGDAICLVSVDEPISDDVIAKVKALPQVIRANRLKF
jgi:D-3-phosphoglycerate dehydrogenase